MSSTDFKTKNGKYVYDKYWFRIELDYPLSGYPTLLIKSKQPDSEKEIELHIERHELESIAEMFNQAKNWRRTLTEKAEEEANVILDMDPPMEYVIAHFRKKYESNNEYASLLLEKTFEILDFCDENDYENDEKVKWYFTLRDIEKYQGMVELKEERSTAGTMKSSVETTKITTHYANELDELYESESDYWERVAEDSGMTIEEYFNSED